MSDGAVLDVVDVSKQFGPFRALTDVSLRVQPGQTLGLVGPNGSGKTTLINLMTGVYRVSSGHVYLGGRDVTRLPAFRRSRLGVNRTFQIPRPLGALTVGENVAVAARHRRSEGPFSGDPLSFVGLSALAGRPASSLTTGQQKQLDLARAVATNPDVLLVDELGAGLSPAELEQVAELLKQLASGGMALVVVEHLLGFLEAVVDTVLVLDAGQELFRGTLRDAVADRRVVEVFLGS